MTLNLVQHRGAVNVWDRPAGYAACDTERWLLAMFAGGCLVSGIRRRSALGLGLVVGAGLLAWWATAGLDERNRWRGQVRAAMPHRRRPADRVVEASEESFPASDAPSWTPTVGNIGPASGGGRN